MTINLRVLLVEDSEDDAWSLLRVLQKGGYEVTYTRVETEEQMCTAITTPPIEGGWDIIISDYIMPYFSGMAVLRLAQEHRPNIPFILVSGIVDEVLGEQALNLGARDFLMKSQLQRLPAIVEREMMQTRAMQPAIASREAAKQSPTRDQEIASSPSTLLAATKEKHMNKRILLALGLVLLALAALVKFAFVPQWTQRIPPGWTYESEFVGIQTPADEKTGKFPDKDAYAIYDLTIHVLAPVPNSLDVIIEDSNTILDPLTRKKIWEYVYRAPVDPQTGAHTTPEYRGDIILFPRNTQPITYRLRSNYLKGVPLAFQQEEVIEGITVYLFAYKGRAEYTESYEGTADYPGVKVAEGQEIRCADDQFSYMVWIEPLTGETFKVDNSCVSGDYIYDTATNKPLIALMRWNGTNTGDDIVARAEYIRNERTKILWLDVYMPAILLVLAFAVLGLAVWAVRFPMSGKPND